MMTNVVLGGGISGLSAAYYLSKSVKDGVKLYESSNRLGGWIKTTHNKNGTLFEQGPRTLKCGGPAADNTLSLVKELGLFSKVKPVLRSDEAAKNRMIYVDNDLIKLPNSWTALFKINPPFIKPFIFAIVKDLRTSKKNVTDESIYDFVSRRFGKEYADVPLSAMICGIFAGDAKEISVKSLMSGLLEKEQTYGSVCKGMLYSIKNNLVNKKEKLKNIESNNWSVWSLEQGLETLPKHLGNYLHESEKADIHLKSKCTNISFKNGEVLLTINGKVQHAQHLHSAISSKELAKIIDDDHSFLKRELSAIPFVTVATVNLAYDEDLLVDKGFGLLVPPNQNLPILGIIFDSCIFPQNGKTVLSVMMGGKWFEHYFGLNPGGQKFMDIARSYVKTILKIDKQPINAMVSVMKDCIPQYIVGHSERVQRLRRYIADKNLPLSLIGNSFDGVGVNDAILSAKTNVELSVGRNENDDKGDIK